MKDTICRSCQGIIPASYGFCLNCGATRSKSHALAFMMVSVALLVIVLIVGMFTLPGFTTYLGSLETLFDSEAMQKTKAVFAQQSVKCGDSYYEDKYLWGLFEFKNVSFSVEEAALAEPDHLNGTQWKGTGKVKSNLMRSYVDSDKKWSDWRAPNLFSGMVGISTDGTIATYILEKRQGKWFVNGANILEDMMGGPLAHKNTRTCDQIPK